MKFEEALAKLREGKTVQKGDHRIVLMQTPDGKNKTLQIERNGAFTPWHPTSQKLFDEDYEEVEADAE